VYVVGSFGGLQAAQKILLLTRAGDNIASAGEQETIREQRSR